MLDLGQFDLGQFDLGQFDLGQCEAAGRGGVGGEEGGFGRGGGGGGEDFGPSRTNLYDIFFGLSRKKVPSAKVQWA